VEAFHRSADRRLDMVREIESLLARAAQDAGHAAGGGGGSGAARLYHPTTCQTDFFCLGVDQIDTRQNQFSMSKQFMFAPCQNHFAPCNIAFATTKHDD
jgi:hypothetical protein